MECKVTVTDAETGVYKNLEIIIPRQLFNKKYDEALSKASARAELKGFRKGKAPKDVVNRLFGDSIRSEITDKLLNDAYIDIVDNNSFRIFREPVLTADTPKTDHDGDLKFSGRLVLIPEPNLKDYLNVECEVELYDENDSCEDFVKHTIEQFRQEKATFNTIEGRDVVQEGDTIVVEGSILHNNKKIGKFQGGPLTFTLGENSDPRLLKELCGAKIGENRNVIIEDVGTSGKTETMTYDVCIKQIQAKQLPELSDEFIKSSGVGDSLEDFKSKIKKYGVERIITANRTTKISEILKKITASNNFPIADEIIEQVSLRRLINRGWINQDTKLDRESLEKFISMERPYADASFRKTIITDRIIKQEGIEVSDADVNRWLDNATELNGVSRDQINKFYGFPEKLVELKVAIAREQIENKLLDTAKIKVTSVKKYNVGGENVADSDAE